jgi:hypothetical protein
MNGDEKARYESVWHGPQPRPALFTRSGGKKREEATRRKEKEK